MSSPRNNHTSDFLNRLVNVRPTSAGWEASCPCRDDDSNPSLAVAESDDGKILVHCHRGNGCDVERICASVGLTTSALYPPKEKEQPKEKEKLTFVKSYDYLDENGNLLFQKVRYVNQHGVKTFRQRKPVGKGEWEYSLGDTPKVLYNLPTVIKAVRENIPIWVVEGEKDADTLTEMGMVATTAPGGAGKWLDIHTQALAGATVDIIADNDKPGHEHAAIVHKALSDAGCDVQAWTCPSSKDITDYIASGGDIGSLVFFDVDLINNEETKPAVEAAEMDAGDEAIQRISALLIRDDLTTQQKLIKVSNALHSYTTPADMILDKGRLVNWEEFLKESTSDEYEWVIPWLLEKNERVIVVAAEGVGKTMLARQVAILAATGMHPFTYQRIKPVKTLTVDLENPERIIRRTSRSIQENALKYGFERRSIAELFSKPSGLDLLNMNDRILLEEQIEKAKPEILVMGPLYKAFVDPGGRTSEAVAVEVAKYLDYIRVTYNCALWLEHHAPLGQSQSTRELRPFGSAVWSRWPEFGLALQPDFGAMTPYTYDVRHFRGARDERPWPTKIKRGKRFPFEVVEFSGVSE